MYVMNQTNIASYFNSSICMYGKGIQDICKRKRLPKPSRTMFQIRDHIFRV